MPSGRHVARAVLDLRLRYRPVLEIDLARFDLWARQVLVDASSGDPAGAGDVASLEWVWDRIAHTLPTSNITSIDTQLGDLRAADDSEDLTAAAEAAMRLRATLAELAPASRNRRQQWPGLAVSGDALLGRQGASAHRRSATGLHRTGGSPAGSR